MKRSLRRQWKMAFLASLLGITLAMPGCTRTPKASSVPITEVQKISFSQQGMARAAITNRIIRRTDQGAEIKAQRSCRNSGTVRSRILCILQMHRSCKRPENFLRPTMSAAGTVSKAATVRCWMVKASVSTLNLQMALRSRRMGPIRSHRIIGKYTVPCGI